MAGGCLQQFFATRNEISGSTRLWSITSIFWPTLAAFVAAVLNLVLNTAILLAYFWGTETVEKVDKFKGYFTKFTSVIQTAFAATVAASLFLTRNNSDSLLQQTCSDAADQKAPMFPQINLDGFCLKQVSFPLR